MDYNGVQVNIKIHCSILYCLVIDLQALEVRPPFTRHLSPLQQFSLNLVLYFTKYKN
jgi:hypothetical protein